ncbi:hypothetical protein Ddye_016077, partial [Dipteronia dyeriana]
MHGRYHTHKVDQKKRCFSASFVKIYRRKKHRIIPVPKSADPDLVNESGHQ